MEIWCNLLSHGTEAPFVVIQDSDHAEPLCFKLGGPKLMQLMKRV